jgi:hypothetical protein
MNEKSKETLEFATALFRLVICSECFNVKAVLTNFIGDTSFCPCCRKPTVHFLTNNFIKGVEMHEAKI